MTKPWTEGPWSWQGEDYRGGWGWQILVGPNGEGLIVGDDCGEPSPLLKAFQPVPPKYCVTGLAGEGKERVDAVHVYLPANARLISKAPELVEALEADREFLEMLTNYSSEYVSSLVRKRIEANQALLDEIYGEDS